MLAGPGEPAPRKQRGKRRPTIVELLDRAEATRAAIEGGGVNRAEVARREGLTRARVTQLLNLLELTSDVQAEIRRLAATGVHLSERSLRPLVGRPPSQQLAGVRRAVSGRAG